MKRSHKAGAKVWGTRSTGLRVLLNRWNPIGVTGLPDDEYDCLIGPILSRLARGVSAPDLRRFLTKHLEEHFGLPSRGYGVAQFADRAWRWFHSRRLSP